MVMKLMKLMKPAAPQSSLAMASAAPSLLLLLLLLLFLSSSSSFFPTAIANNNITQILAPHPSYSSFVSLCQRTGVAAQIFSRTTITVLAPPNAALDAALSPSMSAATLYAIASYHVLLDYFDTAKLKAITNGTTLSTTLYQASGQASGKEGFVNITSRGYGGEVRIGAAAEGAERGVAVQNELFKQPYNISVVSVSGVLVPEGVGAPSPAPAPVNFTQILVQSKNYNTFLSLIQATGVDALLLKHDAPPGVTIFAPDDAAFAKLPKGALAALTSAEKVALLEFHCLGSYYSTQELGALGGGSAAQQTLASGSGGGKYEYAGISLSKAGQTVIDSGYNKVPVGPTLYSQEPLGLYGIAAVLLPTDIFGLPPSAAPSPSPSSPSPSPSPSPSSPSPSPSPSSPSPSPSSPAASPPAPPGSDSDGAPSPNSDNNSSSSASPPPPSSSSSPSQLALLLLLLLSSSFTLLL